MSKKRKPVYDVDYISFGEQLIHTNDLDPVYVMLVDAELEDKTLFKFLLAYWCWYHAGVAAHIAESKSFYKAMKSCIPNNIPRGMERRYFYGDNAKNCVKGLMDAGDPERIVEDMCDHSKFWNIYNSVIKYNGFGPWMGWKIADMAERVLCYDVNFSDCNLGIYKDPRQAAALLVYGDKEHPISDQELKHKCDVMEKQLYHLKAPPWDDRPINVQEIETVLCKYKAHCFGAYPWFNDTTHLYKALEDYRSDLGDQLLEALSKRVPLPDMDDLLEAANGSCSKQHAVGEV